MIIINHFYYLYLPCKKAGKSRRYCKKEYSKKPAGLVSLQVFILWQG